MVRKKRESDSRRREEKWHLLALPRPAKRMQNGAGFSRKTKAYWACWKGKSVFSATERAVVNYARAAIAKRKRNRAVCPEHQIGGGRDSRWARAAPWREREENQSGSKEKKGWTLQSRKADFKEWKGQARKASLGEVKGSISVWVHAKASRRICRVLVSLERRLGDEEPTHKIKEWNESRWHVEEIGKPQKKGRIGENERQPVRALLAAWWKRSNLMILVMLKKENHPGVAYVRKGRRKALYRREWETP